MKSGISTFMNFPKEKFKGRDESGAGWQCGSVVWNRRAGC